MGRLGSKSFDFNVVWELIRATVGVATALRQVKKPNAPAVKCEAVEDRCRRLSSSLAHAWFFVTVISGVAVMRVGILFALSYDRASGSGVPDAQWCKHEQS
jgi:hypothetical protein